MRPEPPIFIFHGTFWIEAIRSGNNSTPYDLGTLFNIDLIGFLDTVRERLERILLA
jgi:hypothetical protein